MTGGGNADRIDTTEEEEQQLEGNLVILESKKRLMSAQNGARRKRTTLGTDYIQGGPIMNYQSAAGGKNPLVKTGGGS